jgi:hypothetical protein
MKKAWPDGLQEQIGISALEATANIDYLALYTSTGQQLLFSRRVIVAVSDTDTSSKP